MGFFLKKSMYTQLGILCGTLHLDLYDAEPPESWKNLKRHDVSVPNEIGQKGQVLWIKRVLKSDDRWIEKKFICISRGDRP